MSLAGLSTLARSDGRLTTLRYLALGGRSGANGSPPTIAGWTAQNQTARPTSARCRAGALLSGPTVDDGKCPPRPVRRTRHLCETSSPPIQRSFRESHPAAIAVTEFHIYGAGRLDVLCIEPSGALTLCEAKLQRNPEIRRRVTGQVLAYASGLAQMSFDEVDQAWASRCGLSLAISVLGVDAEADDVRTFEASVRQRLAGGHFRLVLAVDELTPELRRTITYLARHTTETFELVALELATPAVTASRSSFPAPGERSQPYRDVRPGHRKGRNKTCEYHSTRRLSLLAPVRPPTPAQDTSSPTCSIDSPHASPTSGSVTLSESRPGAS